jgi:hypothetical protein
MDDEDILLSAEWPKTTRFVNSKREQVKASDILANKQLVFFNIQIKFILSSLLSPLSPL